MRKKTDDYINIRVWLKTMHRLRVITAITGKSIIETIDRLTLQEFAHLSANGGAQVEQKQNAAIMEITEQEFNRLMDKRLREDPEFRARYEEVGKRIEEHERKNVYP